jgi:DNA-binding SARP family transcriptional activator
VIDFRILGTLELRPAAGASALALTQPKRIALLLYLTLAEPAGPKSRDSLMALLWPEADDESARHSLRNALYGLRQALGETAFVARGEGYVGLDPNAIRCDALELRRLLAEQRWEEAVVAWGGDLVPGFHVSGAQEFEQWLDHQRLDFRRSVTDAAWRWVDDLERRGDAGVTRAAQRAWALEPGNEAGARRLMRFLNTSAGHAAALRAYDDLADYLRREFQSEPSAETRALAAELKARVANEISHSSPKPAGASRPTPALGPAAGGTPSSSGPPRRHRSTTLTGIAGALLLLGLFAVFAVRSTRSPGSASTVAMQAGRDSVLRLPEKYRRDTSAYASYLRGLALRFTDSDASRDTFVALVKREPLYAPGLSGLAHSYALNTVAEGESPALGWPKVEATAKKALALDSTSASAYLALAMLEAYWHWDLPRARNLIDRGVALEPGDPEAHALKGVWFRWNGEMDSAVAEARTSYHLDPVNPSWGNRLARQLYLAKRYQEAEVVYRQMVRENPRNLPAYSGLSDVYRALGRPKDAMAILRAGNEATGRPVPPQLQAWSDSQAARVFQEWSRDRLRDLLKRARSSDVPPADDIAVAYAELHEKDSTLLWIDSMVAAHNPRVWAVPLDPVFDFLRDDPRYRRLEANLPWRRSRAARTDTER